MVVQDLQIGQKMAVFIDTISKVENIVASQKKKKKNWHI